MPWFTSHDETMAAILRDCGIGLKMRFTGRLLVHGLCITRVDADVLARLGMADRIDELVTKRAIAFA